jgi:hypothetical protein
MSHNFLSKEVQQTISPYKIIFIFCVQYILRTLKEQEKSDDRKFFWDGGDNKYP